MTTPRRLLPRHGKGFCAQQTALFGITGARDQSLADPQDTAEML